MSDRKPITKTTVGGFLLLTLLIGCGRERERWEPFLFRHEGRWVAFHHVAIDKDGTKWFATSVGIRRFDGRTWTVYDTSNSPISHNSINTLFVDRGGNVWAACWYHGVVRFNPRADDGRAWTTFSKSDGLVDNYVHALAEDREGNIWFGTSDGVSMYSPQEGKNSWAAYRPENSGLTSSTVTAIAVDDSGEIWFGTSPMWVRSAFVGGGVVVYNPSFPTRSAWTTYDTTNSGLPSNSVRAIVIDGHSAARTIWIGTEKGLSRFIPNAPEANRWERFDKSSGSLPSDVVNAIAIDRSGNVWVAAADMGVAEAFKVGGVSLFNGATWSTFTVTNSKLQDNRALDVAVDSRNNVWVCEFVGVDVYNDRGVMMDQ